MTKIELVNRINTFADARATNNPTLMQFAVNYLNEAIAELPIPDKADDEPEEEELVLDDPDE
jgi:hypothetical protein